MTPPRVVVDGSNIATEGRSMPSLRQLDEAVRQFQDEFPDRETIVVVDATFGHRIDASERDAFADAVAHGELVSPPAGAIGRGDAFVLRIAERVGGQVLSNDSFQEFHQEHPWLFDEGRLMGGKPVPGVGWIFTLRTPVRGPRSRGAAPTRGPARPKGGQKATGPTATATRRRRSKPMLDALEAAAAEATEAAVEGHTARDGDAVASRSGTRRRRRRRGGGDPAVQAAIDAATEEAIGTEPEGPSKRTRRRPRQEEESAPQAVNDPLTFLTFISEHPLGATVKGAVSTFVSHGAMVDVGPMHCYVPLSGLGSPPPKSARQVLRRGETRAFVVVALDPPRRGAQLALPELAAAATIKSAKKAAKATAKAQADGRSEAAQVSEAAPKPAKTAGMQAQPAKAAKAPKAPAKAPAKTAKAAKAAKAPEKVVKATSKSSKAPAKTAKGPATAPAKATKAAKSPAKAAKATKTPQNAAKRASTATKARPKAAKATSKATKAPAKTAKGSATAPSKAAKASSTTVNARKAVSATKGSTAKKTPAKASSSRPTASKRSKPKGRQ